MQVRKRMVNSKRHTVGYLIGNRWRTRSQAVHLAKQGVIHNVSVRRGGGDEEYIASLPYYTQMYELPTVVAPSVTEYRREHGR